MNYNCRFARTVFQMITCLSVAGCAGFQVFDSEKDAVWDNIREAIPQMRVYEKRTDRNIRVFRLTRTKPSPPGHF